MPDWPVTLKHSVVCTILTNALWQNCGKYAHPNLSPATSLFTYKSFQAASSTDIHNQLSTV